MTAFRVWSLLLPLLVGFGVPAILAWRPGRDSVRPACTYLAALLSVAFLLRLFTAEEPGVLMAITFFTLAFALFVTGVTLGVPHAVAGQIVAGLLVILLTGTVFYAGPAIVDAPSRPALEARMNAALAVNPYVLVAASIFQTDVLRQPVLYSVSPMADYHGGHYPDWKPSALVFAIIGALLTALRWAIERRRSIGIRRLGP